MSDLTNIIVSLNESAAKASTYTEKLKQVAAGDKDTTVDIDGQLIPTLARNADIITQALNDLRYQRLGDYETGIEITNFGQVVREAGEFYALKPDQTLPYTTTGTWVGDDENRFAPVGDAVLRSDLAAAGGASLVSNGGIVFDSVADMVAADWLTVGDKVRTLGYYTPGDGGGNDYEIVAATGTDDGGSFIDLTGVSGQAKGLFVGGIVSVKQFGAKGDGVADDKQRLQNQADSTERLTINTDVNVDSGVNIKKDRSFVFGNGSKIRNASNDVIPIRIGDFNSSVDGDKTFDVTVSDLYVDRVGVVDTSDNFANISSVASRTRYRGITVEEGYVGLSLQKNYAISTPLATANNSIITDCIVKSDYLGYEHFATTGCVTTNSIALTSTPSAFGGYRYTGDSDNNSYQNVLSGVVSSGFSNGLTTQTACRNNVFSAVCVSDSINGISIPANTSYINDHNRFNYYQANIDNCDRAFDGYNINYQQINLIATNISGAVLTNRVGASFGEKKSNIIDVLAKDVATVGTLDLSNTIYRVNATDIQNNGLRIDGNNNHITIIVDKANLSNGGSVGLWVTGDNNIIDVISTGNTNIFNDIVIQGDYNTARVNSDKKLVVSGNNNIVDGFANSLTNSGTSNTLRVITR